MERDTDLSLSNIVCAEAEFISPDEQITESVGGKVFLFLYKVSGVCRLESTS
jgi:hypothetical protein